MKTALDILSFLETYTNEALQRPEMYASSPGALEDVLMFIDKLQHYIVSPEPGAVSPYVDFLISRDFGAATFTQNPKNRRKTFDALCGFWKEYLRSAPEPGARE